jgi:hypothetical protein
MSSSTNFLAHHLCGGSSRKLISGWWYERHCDCSVFAFSPFFGTMEPLSPEGERIVGYFVMSNTHTLFGCVRIITSWGKKKHNRYSILLTTMLLAITAFAVLNGNARRPAAEGWASVGAAVISVVLSVGGTMILRKFHNSMAVGFFMGSILATSQMFFTLALVYISYAQDLRAAQHEEGGAAVAKEEYFMAVASFLQSALLGSFALLLTAHRSELENPASSPTSGGGTAASEAQADGYTEMSTGAAAAASTTK